MKQVCITDIPVGTRFNYTGRDGETKEWEVVSREEYPFIEAKCISEKHDHNTLFWDFEKVEVADETRTYKRSFVAGNGKKNFVMKEELI